MAAGSSSPNPGNTAQAKRLRASKNTIKNVRHEVYQMDVRNVSDRYIEWLRNELIGVINDVQNLSNQPIISNFINSWYAVNDNVRNAITELDVTLVMIPIVRGGTTNVAQIADGVRQFNQARGACLQYLDEALRQFT